MGKFLSALMQAGWTVTFPAFIDARAYTVHITKGSEKHVLGWINDQTLADALIKLNAAALTDEYEGSEPQPGRPGG